VERLQPLLIGHVELLALAIGEARGLSRRHLIGRQPAVLPAVDQHREHARGPAFFVELFGLKDHLDQADLIVDVENREVVLQADQLGVAAQDLDPDRVERAEPRHALDDLPDHLADAVLHLARGLVGEGNGENLARIRAPEIEDMRDARGDHTRLAGSRAGKHQHGTVERLHRLSLLGVELSEVSRGARPKRARGDATRSGLRTQWSRVVTLWLGHVVRLGRYWRPEAARMILSIAKMALAGAIFEAGRGLARLPAPN